VESKEVHSPGDRGMNEVPKLVLRCVNCGSALGLWSPERTEYVCRDCKTTYPVRDGILDFVGDREVLGNAQMSSFAKPQPDDLGRRLIDARLRALLSQLPSFQKGEKLTMLLDVGGGYGDLVTCGAPLFELVVSVNASLAELENESGLLAAAETRNVALIRALAQNLPFMPAQFPAVTCVQVLEHVDNPPLVLAQLRIMLAKPGVLYLAFPNRFTLRREPHTELRGIGFLPKRGARKYAAWAGRSVEYDSVHMLSATEVDRWLCQQFGTQYRFIRSRGHQSRFAKMADHAWDRPILQRLVLLLAGDMEVLAWTSSAGGAKE